MVKQPDAGEIDLMVLKALEPAASQTGTLAQRLERTTGTVEAAVERLFVAGFVEPHGDSVALTRSGRLAVEHLPRSWSTPASGSSAPPIDLAEVVRLIGSWWPANSERGLAERTARSVLLAADSDRETAVQVLSEAFSQGRLSPDELEQRTGRALAARTYGELDGVLQGLGGLQHPVRSHPLRKVAFWVVALLSSPFVFVGGLLLAFGSDVGDHVGGLLLLVLLLPGLFALRRWASPRT